MKIQIYILKDPRTGDVRYVGQTVNIKNRLYAPLIGKELRIEQFSKNKWKYQIL